MGEIPDAQQPQTGVTRSPGVSALLEAAIAAATALGRPADTGDLLLGIAREPTSLRCRALLDEHGLDEAFLATQLADRDTTTRRTLESSGSDGLSGRAHTCLAVADQESRALELPATTLEALLLGLVSDEASLAAALCRDGGASPALLVAALRQGFVADFQPTVHAFAQRFGARLLGVERYELVGRRPELDQLTAILCRSERNVPLLVGPDGIGKRALVEELAWQLRHERARFPTGLAGATVFTIDLTATAVAGEHALAALLSALDGLGPALALVTSLRVLSVSPGVVATQLRPALVSGRLRPILALTPNEAAGLTALDPEIAELTATVRLEEPPSSLDIDIAASLATRFGARHEVVFERPAALKASAHARRYLKEIAFPGSLAVLLDDVAARSRIGGVRTIDEAQVDAVVTALTGVPLERLTEDELTRVQTMEAHLHQRIIGQDDAVSAVARAIRRAKAGIKDARRPLGSFLFVGPSGVGKTELAKALAEFLFGDENALLSFDMSEYGNEGDATKLIGTGPQWIGHDEGGQLTSAVMKRPYSVLLFDEVEKAHPDIFDLFLQLLEEGRLTDGSGNRVEFANTVVIMTSNLGSRELTGTENLDELQAKERAALRGFFRPELLNRLDETVVFHRLSGEELLAVARLLVRGLSNRAGVDLCLSDDAFALVVAEGTDPELGARPLRRALARLVEDPLADLLLAGTLHRGDMADVDIVDGVIAITPGPTTA